jgi:hypothetical protein
MNIFIAILVAAALLLLPARAVEQNGTYFATQPTNAQVPNWTSGWPQSGVTGWNYVGRVNTASGTYLGNGWVLTVGHVGMGNFQTSDGTIYNGVGSGIAVPNPANPTGPYVDLFLFQVSPRPNLAPITISASLPVAFSSTQAGTPVVLVGLGGPVGWTWGYDTVTRINTPKPSNQYTQFVANDFYTDNSVTIGSTTVTNHSFLVDGDSGGGAFVYNTGSNRWELAGINEVADANSTVFSGMVQLNTYAAEINAIVNPSTDSPAMPLPLLIALGALLFFAALFSFGTRSRIGL